MKTFIKRNVSNGLTTESQTSAKEIRCFRTHDVRKLHTTEKKKKDRDQMFKETVTLLSEVFSQKTSLFHKRWKCMNLKKKQKKKNFTTFTSIRNDQCEGFKLAELSSDNSKCFKFVSTKEAEIRRVFKKNLKINPI